MSAGQLLDAVDVRADQKAEDNHISACRTNRYGTGTQTEASGACPTGIFAAYGMACKHKVHQNQDVVKTQGPAMQRLYLGKSMLEDAKQLADLKVENDDVLGLAFQQPGRFFAKLLAISALLFVKSQLFLMSRHVRYTCTGDESIAIRIDACDADGSWEEANISEYVPEMDSTVRA